MNTNELIMRLSTRAGEARKPLPAFSRNITVLLLIIVLYAAVIQWQLGLRADLIAQFARPIYSMEIGLLALLGLTSLVAAVVAMVPDNYNKPYLLRLPYVVLAAFVALLGLRYVMGVQQGDIIPVEEHGIECALCIAANAILPSAMVFYWQRRGASVHPYRAGAYSVLAATAVGCLMLRLAEANDAINHLVVWHYLPTLLLALAGAFIGKWVLKW